MNNEFMEHAEEHPAFRTALQVLRRNSHCSTVRFIDRFLTVFALGTAIFVIIYGFIGD